jgi:hypothetical protein
MSRVFSVSEPGGHPINEDAFVVEAHHADPDCWLCVLADGQGGRAGGGRAAQLACRTAMETAHRNPPDTLAEIGVWPTILRVADQAVTADSEAGFTTLIGLCVRSNVLVGASSGDSAVLSVCGGKAEELTARQWKNPPVGSGVAVFMPFAVKLSPSWAVLAVSDGVWKYTGWDRIIKEMSQQRGQVLLDVILDHSRRAGRGQLLDDFTAVLIEEEPIEPSVDGP